MLEFPKWKIWLIGIVIAIGIILSIPSLIAGTPAARGWPGWMPQYKISLGLDLAGGSHLLLEADLSDALKQRVQSMEDEVQTELRRDPRIDIGDISIAGGRLSFMVRNATQVDAAVERLRNLTKPVALTGNRDWDVQVVDLTRIVMIPTPSGTAQALKDAMGSCSRCRPAPHRPFGNERNYRHHRRWQSYSRRSAGRRGPGSA